MPLSSAMPSFEHQLPQQRMRPWWESYKLAREQNGTSSIVISRIDFILPARNMYPPPQFTGDWQLPISQVSFPSVRNGGRLTSQPTSSSFEFKQAAPVFFPQNNINFRVGCKCIQSRQLKDQCIQFSLLYRSFVRLAVIKKNYRSLQEEWRDATFPNLW